MLPDVEQVVKAWVKQEATLVPLLGTRVSTRLPVDLGQSGGAAFPWLRLFRVPGTSQDRTGAFDVAIIQFDAFAEGPGDERGTPNMRSASQVARTLEAAIAALDGVGGIRLTVDGASATIVDCAVNVSSHRLDEPQTGWARMRVDALFTVR